MFMYITYVYIFWGSHLKKLWYCPVWLGLYIFFVSIGFLDYSYKWENFIWKKKYLSVRFLQWKTFSPVLLLRSLHCEKARLVSWQFHVVWLCIGPVTCGFWLSRKWPHQPHHCLFPWCQARYNRVQYCTPIQSGSNFDCLETKRHTFLELGHTTEVMDTLLASGRQLTVNIYNTTWKAFVRRRRRLSLSYPSCKMG